jgi:hypothetical protein
MIGDMCRKLVYSFEMFNVIQLEKGAIDKVLNDRDINLKEIRNKLVSWLRIEYHPKVLFEDFVHTIEIFDFQKKFTNIESYGQVVNLLYYVFELREFLGLKRLDYIKNQNELEDEKLLLRFYDFAEHFRRLIIN